MDARYPISLCTPPPEEVLSKPIFFPTITTPPTPKPLLCSITSSTYSMPTRSPALGTCFLFSPRASPPGDVPSNLVNLSALSISPAPKPPALDEPVLLISLLNFVEAPMPALQEEGTKALASDSPQGEGPRPSSRSVVSAKVPCPRSLIKAEEDHSGFNMP